MEKGESYFNALTKKQQAEFKQNYATNRKDSLLSSLTFEEFIDMEHPDKLSFFLCAFILDESPEGAKYWRNIIDKN